MLPRTTGGIAPPPPPKGLHLDMLQEHEVGRHWERVLYKSPAGHRPHRGSHRLVRGMPLLSAAASRSGRDMFTSHWQAPMSHQPARESQTEQGLPTHVPPMHGGYQTLEPLGAPRGNRNSRQVEGE